MFRSRYIAVVSLVKRGAKKKEVDDMKAKMVVHEKWELSNLLPQGKTSQTKIRLRLDILYF